MFEKGRINIDVKYPNGIKMHPENGTKRAKLGKVETDRSRPFPKGESMSDIFC